MNRIVKTLSENKNKKLLSIYFTAGFPEKGDTVKILKELEENGVDIVEIGLPFSDPLADGPTIQESSTVALKNGMSTEVLFKQLENIRDEVSIPVLIMGYFNPILQYGVEKFCERCRKIGIDGLIIPDLPVDVYKEEYQTVFEKNGLLNIFLITPQTSESRVRYIDSVSDGFIYMVSSASITGAKSGFDSSQETYFKRIASMDLKNPHLAGFGIGNRETFLQATRYARGAIIGSKFIEVLSEKGVSGISDFIKGLKRGD